MERSAYNMGQLLKACDELHLMYCQVKRDGDVPPQLVGNSVFAMASETPIKAMAILRQRMTPYLAWAKQYGWQKQTPLNPKRQPEDARKYLRLLAHFSSILTNLQPSTRFGEFEQSQVFLGYLANFPKSASMEDKDELNGEEQNND